ncbi:cilia- and flagella-associated protein 157-like [Kryptolebias marmoratus]|uniref:cilia- and flagella-associated protein 157-like n=1 Tax=Kryptolebias marmoratus TaxID=37003 RepID=UPI0018ACF028|nr:cilia- and flagella-associated protein 157-like [Kryptolebias marmoratus]
MDESKDKVKSFVDELRAEFNSGKQSLETLMETWISLTPDEQMKVLCHLMEEGTSQSKGSSFQTPLHQESKIKDSLEDTEQRRAEEKSQMKWSKFQERKRRWVLDQKLEKTIKERDELEIMKIKLNRQRQEAEKKLEDFKTIIMTVAKIKSTMEKTAAQIRTTSEEIFRTQQKMESNSEEIKQYMSRGAHLSYLMSSHPPA